MATNSLQSELDTFQPISRSAVCILARLAAKKAVHKELRSQGVRVTLVKPAELCARANEYLSPASRVVSGRAGESTASWVL